MLEASKESSITDVYRKTILHALRQVIIIGFNILNVAFQCVATITSFGLVPRTKKARLAWWEQGKPGANTDQTLVRA